MTIIPSPPTPIEPAAIYAYFDKIQFWLLNPFDSKTLTWLRKQCGQGGLHVDNKPAKFGARYRQRIELRQPSKEALSWLAERDDALINRVEIAVDYVFKSWAERDDFWLFLHRHSARRWHGKNQEIRLIKSDSDAGDDVLGGTRYDAGRWAPNGTVFYPEHHSRITGELHCLHLEWRLNRLKSVCAAGINSGGDLPAFNHRDFWKKRLLLYTVDPERLGRLNRNHLLGKRNRGGPIGQIGRIDRQTGEVIVRAHHAVQELINTQRLYYRVHRALVSISNETLLPNSPVLLDYGRVGSEGIRGGEIE
jgi:hypothetical protein